MGRVKVPGTDEVVEMLVFLRDPSLTVDIAGKYGLPDSYPSRDTS